MKIEQIKECVRNLDPNLKEVDDGFKVACILIKGTETQNVYDISKFFGYPLPFIKKVAYRLQENGVWKPGRNGGITYCDWFDEETGGISFWLDVNIGLGFIERK